MLTINHYHPFNNLCYIMSEALYHRWGKKNGLKPYYAKVDGMSHWWLQDKNGKVYDLTAGQFDEEFPYHLGKGCGFLTKKPSHRCQELMQTLDHVRYLGRRQYGRLRRQAGTRSK